MTLLELLLVVLILSATALLAVTSLESSQDQTRFEDTRARLDCARRGIVGDFTAGGVERSFVNDIGRLPETLIELVGPIELIELLGLPPWSFDPERGMWAGWRGPYVPVRQESSGLATYRDGWGLSFEPGDPLQGWGRFQLDAGGENLYMQSLGADGQPGGAGYEADFPPAQPNGLPAPLIGPSDHLLDLRGAWIELELVNEGSSQATLPALRLRCLYPSGGSFDWPPTWPPETERDGQPWLSEELDPGVIEAGGSAVLVVRFLAPDAAGALPKRVPAGLRGLVVVEDATGAEVGAPQLAWPVLLAPRAGPPKLALTWRVAP